MARVLVACEYSGIVRDAFLARGHDAISCDLLPTESPGPHIQGDVRPLLRQPWDLVIAHPPCNYLSHINTWMGNDRRYPGFWDKHHAAIDFFMDCYQANAPAVCVENPQPMKAASFFLGRPQDQIQPWMFGDPFQKRTWLWLRGLPPLLRDRPVSGRQLWVDIENGTKKGWTPDGVARSGKDRARFWAGIARAMAEQWGRLL